jgi:hypothetical protein
MEIKESTITTQAIFKNENHRLLLKKTWSDLPSATICMSNSGVMPSIYHMDYTTMFCINALSALGFGSCSIVNLFSYCTLKLDLSGELDSLTCPENIEQIIKCAEESSVFIWALGSIANTYKKVVPYKNSLFEKLRPFQDKIQTIADYKGNINQHPLSPTLRGKPWELVKFTLPEPPSTESKEAEPQAGQNKQTPTTRVKKNDKKTAPLT